VKVSSEEELVRRGRRRRPIVPGNVHALPPHYGASERTKETVPGVELFDGIIPLF